MDQGERIHLLAGVLKIGLQEVRRAANQVPIGKKQRVSCWISLPMRRMSEALMFPTRSPAAETTASPLTFWGEISLSDCKCTDLVVNDVESFNSFLILLAVSTMPPLPSSPPSQTALPCSPTSTQPLEVSRRQGTCRSSRPTTSPGAIV